MNVASAGPAILTWGRALGVAGGDEVLPEAIGVDGSVVDERVFGDTVDAVLDPDCAGGSEVPPDRSDQTIAPPTTTPPITSAGMSQLRRASGDV